ncbi:hypothetical protein PAMA_021142 [Pampus argenteus]
MYILSSDSCLPKENAVCMQAFRARTAKTSSCANDVPLLVLIDEHEHWRKGEEKVDYHLYHLSLFTNPPASHTARKTTAIPRCSGITRIRIFFHFTVLIHGGCIGSNVSFVYYTDPPQTRKRDSVTNSVNFEESTIDGNNMQITVTTITTEPRTFTSSVHEEQQGLLFLNICNAQGCGTASKRTVKRLHMTCLWLMVHKLTEDHYN